MYVDAIPVYLATWLGMVTGTTVRHEAAFNLDGRYCAESAYQHSNIHPRLHSCMGIAYNISRNEDPNRR